MKKMYSLLTGILCCAATIAIAQPSLAPTVIASTGAYSTSGNYSLSYTVGEMTMVQTFTSANGQNILTQGFQQPNDSLITGLLDITPDAYGSFVIYPNPAVDQFWFGFQLPESGRVTLTVFDVLGQKIADIYNGNYESGKTISSSNVSDLAAGVYMVSMTFVSAKDGQTHLNTKKLQVIR